MYWRLRLITMELAKYSNLLGNRQLEIWKSDYADNVKLQVLVPVSAERMQSCQR